MNPTRHLQRLSLVLFTISLVGIGIALWLQQTRFGHPDPANWFNVFYVLFARNEVAGLLLVALFSLVTYGWLRRDAPNVMPPRFLEANVQLWLLLLLIFALAAAGTSLVFHSYALTADENMADFQARIFLSGKVREVVPEFWRPMVRLILPTHATYDPVSHTWMSSYLPVYAALRAFFMSADLQAFTNPVLAALGLLALAALTRNLWPDDNRKPLLAVALLGFSPQFLVTAMTSYSMPAHLSFNLLWLWLYSQPNKKRFWLTPIVGAIALGLHQPFYHALFVAPFLARLVWEKRWRASAWFAFVYLLGIACWFAWWKYFFTGFGGTGSKGTFGLYPTSLVIQPMYLTLLLGWLALPLPLLALLGLTNLRRQRPLIIDAALSCLLTFGFYFFVRLDQAHGWGDRYFHGALGCLILIALVGWDNLMQRIGRSAARSFVLLGLGLTLVLQLPMRCLQVESFTRPFARAAQDFQQSNADVLAFDPRMAWYSADLRRNDPTLTNRPIIVSFFTMTEDEAGLLQKTFPHSRLVSADGLENLGLTTQVDPRYASKIKPR